MEIKTTQDYELFTVLEGNRALNHAHKEKLKKSIKEKYLVTVLVVNEKHQIIDGQHRFHALRELNLPIYYVVVEGYGLGDVQRLNVNSKNWTSEDYTNSYIELGYENYSNLKSFQEKYGFHLSESITILSGFNVIAGGYDFKAFREGRFKIKDSNKAIEVAEKIKNIEKYYDGYNRRAFVSAMLYLFNQSGFEYQKFISKLKIQPTALKKCHSREQYLELIEKIYNYRERDKIRLY